MKNILAEKTQNIQNTFNTSSFEYFCHHCSNKIQNHQKLTCSNLNCKNNYCIPCLIEVYKNTPSFINSNKDINNLNCWKCPACEGKCICNKCKSKSKEETEGQIKNNKFLGKKISSDAELIMWLSNGENTSIDTQNVKFPFVPLNSKIKSKVFDKLIKIAKQCELFYRHKCKNEYIKKNCSNCFETNFHQNDLLRFFNYETFLYYMKYLFFVSNKIVAYSKDNFNRNKNDFEELFKRFKNKEEIWVFKDTKIICKQCMYFLINKPNFFQNIKDVFLRQEKKIFLLNNNIELDEQKNNEKYNSINNNKLINNNIVNNHKNLLDDILTSKKIFKIIKNPKNESITNTANINNNEGSNNIIINYNNHNNNIFNTLIFSNEYKINNNQIYGINLLENSIQFPFINNFFMNNNFNYLNSLSSINFNYIESLFFALEKKMTEFFDIVNLSKKDKNKVKYLTGVDLMNQKIINYFKLIEGAIITNLNFLNSLILKYNINVFNNDKEFIEIKPKIIELIADNKKNLSLLNSLKFNYLNAENIYIKSLFQ